MTPPGERPPGRPPADGRAPDPQPRHEPAPGTGKLFLWVLVFLVAALAVVLGGVHFT